MYYVYILKCSDESLYTGWTNDLDHRLAVHQSGKGAKYTRGRLPVSLVYHELCSTKQMAQQREYAIKHMSRLKKMELIAQL